MNRKKSVRFDAAVIDQTADNDYPSPFNNNNSNINVGFQINTNTPFGKIDEFKR